MLRDILDQRGISVYKLSKDTDIAYSTLNDIVIEKTDIKNASANILYRLAKYLDLSMEMLYEGTAQKYITINLHNEGRNVILEFSNERVQYLGPKNLICFNRINKISSNVVHVDCSFVDENGTIYTEEDYIDLGDVLREYTEIISNLYLIQIGKKNSSPKEKLIDTAMLVSDNIAILYYSDPNIPDQCIQTICLSRPSFNAVIRLKDMAVISSNMTERLLNRAIDAVKRNYDEISEDIEEVIKYA